MFSSILPLGAAGHHQGGAERRQTERVAVSLAAAIHFPDRMQTVQGSVTDFSVGGACFIGPYQFAAGQACTLAFQLPPTDRLPARAVSLAVVAVSQAQAGTAPVRFRVHLRFTALPAATRSHIEACLLHGRRC